MNHTPSSPTLGVIIHTKNEAVNIEACIQSCLLITNNISIFDMGSTDQTQEKAKRLGARVVSVPDFGYVEPVRQQAIDSVKTDWILILDADEQLSPSLCKLIQEYIQDPHHDVIALPRKNIIFGKWMQHGLMWPDYQVRLFRRGHVTWSKKIHSQPKIKGTLYKLPALEENAIIHNHSTSVRVRLEKISLQAASELTDIPPANMNADQFIINMMNELPLRYFEHHGYQDGVHGFVVAKLMEYYKFISFLNYWERHDFKDVLSVQDLKGLLEKDKQLQLLREENTRIHDSKLFQLYMRIKNMTQFVKMHVWKV